MVSASEPVLQLIYSSMNLTLGSVSGYLPTIIASLGYSNARAQLFTVPPYAVAFVVMFIFNRASDRLQSRGIPCALVFLLSFIGWIILLGVHHNNHARYFATFLIVIGGYCAIPLNMAWASNNSGSQSQRAVWLGMLNSVGQCLSILAAFAFPTKQAPFYHEGVSLKYAYSSHLHSDIALHRILIVTLLRIHSIAFSLFAMVLSLAMSAYYRWENKRRDTEEGGRPPKSQVLNVIEEHDLARVSLLLCVARCSLS